VVPSPRYCRAPRAPDQSSPPPDQSLSRRRAQEALEKLVESPLTKLPLSPLLWTSFSSWALGRRGGFFGLFGLVFAHFHAQFVEQGLGCG